MQESQTFSQLVFSVLQANEGQQLSPTDIANLIVKTYPKFAEDKKQSTTQENYNPVDQFRKQFHAGIKKWMKDNHELNSSEETPRTYWWENATSDNEASPQLEIVDKFDETESQYEKDLYPMVAKYLWEMKSRKLYPMRIDEKKAANTNGKEGNKFLYPDLVALEDLMPSNVWKENVRLGAIASGAPQSKIWSFEVKYEINSISDARKSYLQAITNSAWANYGYLVATKISTTAFDELKLFHELHGIGVLLLDTGNPENDTVIKLSARERESVDWPMCNRIACQNKDFEQFLGKVADFHKLGKTHKKDWYEPPKD